MPPVTFPAEPLAVRRPASVYVRGRGWTGSEVMTGLTILWVVVVAIFFVLVCVVSEKVWFGTLALFLPKVVLLGPGILLTLVSLIFRPSLVLPHLMCLALIAGPIMGLTVPLETPPPAPESALRIVSYNLQNNEGETLMEAMAELDFLNADIILLQETQEGCEEIADRYHSLHQARNGEFWMLSKYPVHPVSFLKPVSSPRERAQVCEVDLPGGPMLVCNLHLRTPRVAIMGLLKPEQVLSGSGGEKLASDADARRIEMAELRGLLTSLIGDRECLIGGDFNTPSASSLYAEHFGRFANAFDKAGTGYGYTAPCKGNRLWPANTPWARIDHILTPQSWVIHKAEIGKLPGSDHRLTTAVVSRADN